MAAGAPDGLERVAELLVTVAGVAFGAAFLVERFIRATWRVVRGWFGGVSRCARPFALQALVEAARARTEGGGALGGPATPMPLGRRA